MRIRITRTVPGLVDYRPMVAGHEYDTDTTTAISLMEDGYAEMIGDPAIGRATPAEGRETATAKRGPGRPRKGG